MRAERFGHSTVQRVSGKIQRIRAVRRAARTIGGARGCRLALVYHRIAPREVPRYEMVPTVPEDLFRRHLEAIAELGLFVPLERLLDEPHPGEPIRLALTFDDDYPTHTIHALPALRALDLHGTFFLSGRVLHGLGTYWWERLERLVAEQGVEETARLLHLPVRDPASLALACEGDAHRQRLIERHAPDDGTPLPADGIRELVAAGMAIGFHTVHHEVMSGLPDGELERALTFGRDDLAGVVGGPLRIFAYPHGKADARVAAQARDAAYSAAWTASPRLTRTGDDRYLLGRWEPSPLAVDDLLIRLARFITVDRAKASS